MKSTIVRITQEHTERYIELARSGTNAMGALPIVAKEFGLPQKHTRQAVQAKLRRLGIHFKSAAKGRPRVARTAVAGKQTAITLDAATEAVIKAFELASRVPGMEEEINRLQNQNAALKNKNVVLEDAIKNHNEKNVRFKLAVQQGEVNPPSGKGNLGSDFTYHILLNDPKLVNLIATTTPLLNISEGVFCFN